MAVLALLTVGLSVVGRDVAAAMTHGFFIAPDDPRWQAIGSIIAWTAVGVLLQGVYLLTSIGLNITKHTEYLSGRDHGRGRYQRRAQFPADPPLRDRRPLAWANAAAYSVQAVLGAVFSQRFYPVSV